MRGLEIVFVYDQEAVEAAVGVITNDDVPQWVAHRILPQEELSTRAHTTAVTLKVCRTGF